MTLSLNGAPKTAVEDGDDEPEEGQSDEAMPLEDRITEFLKEHAPAKPAVIASELEVRLGKVMECLKEHDLFRATADGIVLKKSDWSNLLYDQIAEFGPVQSNEFAADIGMKPDELRRLVKQHEWFELSGYSIEIKMAKGDGFQSTATDDDEP